MYYNYHGQNKKWLAEGRLTGYKFVARYRHIAPALLLFFADRPPRPIREYRWPEYLPLLFAGD